MSTLKGTLFGAVVCMTVACGTESGSDASTTSEGATTTGPVLTTAVPTTTGEDASTSGTPMTTAMTTTAADSTTGGSSEGEVDTGPTVYFDLGAIPEAPGSEGPCGKVDFLFVIDNSGSMYEEQVNLVNSFPGFITAIQGTLETVEEYNLGVVTTDASTYNNAVPGCNVLGGLVTKTGGGQSSNMVCGPYADGANYMTQSDDLAVKFACAAQVGTSGNGYELTMQAVLNAVDPTSMLAMAGGCNEGFIREDALLVVVIITDEYDGMGDPEGMTSAGLPMDWYDAVVAAKGGIAENVVVVSLVNYMGGPCPPTSTVFDGVNIVDFTNLFGDNGLVGGVCELDYSPVFADAVSIIDVACDNFMPPN